MPTEIPIVASAKQALQVLLQSEGRTENHHEWISLLKNRKKSIHSPINEILKVLSLNMQLICYMKLQKGEAIVTTDVGQHQNVGSPILSAKKSR